jgi:polysaccharide chain length determinant protein (PEP-CTERM system associated)
MDANESKGLSAFTVLRALNRRKWYLLAPVLLFTAAAIVYTLKQPPRFRARTLIVALPVIQANAWNGNSGAAATAAIQDQLRSIRETLLSDPVLKTVIAEYHLASPGNRTPAQAEESLKSNIEIQVEAADAFYVSFESQRPLQAMQVANRLAELFVARTSDLRGERVEEADSFLDSEVQRLQTQLRNQEEALKAYRQSVAHVLPERLATNLKLLESLQQEMRNKTDQITEGQARRLAVNEEMQGLEQQGALDAAVRERTPADANLEELRLKLRQLKARYTVRNPEIERTEREIRDLEASVVQPGNRREPTPVRMRYVALKAEAQSIDQRLRSYQQERTALALQIAASERRIDSSPGLETTLAQRGREAALTRSQYESMLARQQEANVGQRLQKVTKGAGFKIAEPAQLPPSPSIPRRFRFIFLAFAGSMAMGLISVLVVEQMDTTFDTVEEFQSFTNLPVLSAIPAIPRHTAGRFLGKLSGSRRDASLRPGDLGLSPELFRHYRENRLAVLSDPQSIPSEQYSILAMKVEKWAEESGGQVLVVSSSAGGEGKSVTALNLSLALSASQKGRVLLVDSDLRRPMVHKYLGLNLVPENAMGFSDLLAQTHAEIGSYISKVGNLDVIPGGTLPENPVGILSSPRAQELLARMRRQYRLIILDSPPIVPIADSHVLAALADGVVIVVRARQTRRELFRRAIQSLSAANVLGVVLNDVEYGDTRYAYAYRHYQRHYVDQA